MVRHVSDDITVNEVHEWSNSTPINSIIYEEYSTMSCMSLSAGREEERDHSTGLLGIMSAGVSADIGFRHMPQLQLPEDGMAIAV